MHCSSTGKRRKRTFAYNNISQIHTTNLVFDANTDVGLHQQLRDLLPLQRSSDVQRRVAVLVLVVQATFCRNEDARHSSVAIACCCV